MFTTSMCDGGLNSPIVQVGFALPGCEGRVVESWGCASRECSCPWHHRVFLHAKAVLCRCGCVGICGEWPRSWAVAWFANLLRSSRRLPRQTIARLLTSCAACLPEQVAAVAL